MTAKEELDQEIRNLLKEWDIMAEHDIPDPPTWLWYRMGAIRSVMGKVDDINKIEDLTA